MFLLPIGTDAPVHHFPWATISLIVAKTVVFVGAACGWLPVESLVLAYGDGLHPVQWLTSLFVHDGLPLLQLLLVGLQLLVQIVELRLLLLIQGLGLGVGGLPFVRLRGDTLDIDDRDLRTLREGPRRLRSSRLGGSGR